MNTAEIIKNLMKADLSDEVVERTIKSMLSFGVEETYSIFSELVKTAELSTKQLGWIAEIIFSSDCATPTELVQDSKQPDLKFIITDILHELGVPANIEGYEYLREAILLTIEDKKCICSMTKKLYPTIAEKFGTTPNRAERGMRYAIEIGWDRGDVDTLTEYFGYTINQNKGKPTNSEFIAMIADKIKLEYKRS